MPVDDVRPSRTDAVAAVESLGHDGMCSVTNETRRRNSVLYQCEVEGKALMVKFERGLTSQKAEATAAWSRQLRQVFEDAGADHLEAVEITATPTPFPALVMDYVDGTDLSTLVARAVGRAASATDRRLASDSSAVAGTALGVLHTRLEPPQGDTNVFERVQRRFRLSSEWRSNAGRLTVPVAQVGDFAPYNLRRSRDGELWLLDISGVPRTATAHADVGMFLTGLTRSVRETRRRRIGAFRAQMTPLYTAFLGGYAEFGPFDPFDSAHAELVDWVLRYELSNVVIKSLRRGGRQNAAIALSLMPLVVSRGLTAGNG